MNDVARMRDRIQSEAIAACSAGLKKPCARGQCIMACGTGKTRVGFQVAARQ